MQSNSSHDDVFFGILGPLEGWEGERRLKLGGVVNERVLVMLLLEAGRVVPVARLIQAVWDQKPPSRPSSRSARLWRPCAGESPRDVN